MNPEQFAVIVQEILNEITEPRFYETERGYQGELLAGLRARLAEARFAGDPIIEQEHQKRIKPQGIRIRPDVIIHIPFARGTVQQRREGNFVAIELKLDPDDVTAAFDNLRQLKTYLDYPVTILVMVGSAETYAHLCPQEIAGQTVCFAARLEEGRPVVTMEACAALDGPH